MAKKITKATFKGFLKSYKGSLYVNVHSAFDGMTDCVESRNQGFRKAEKTDFQVEHTLGVDSGIWLVGSSRDYFYHYEDEYFTGIEVINACGSFVVAIAKKVEEPEYIDFEAELLN